MVCQLKSISPHGVPIPLPLCQIFVPHKKHIRWPRPHDWPRHRHVSLLRHTPAYEIHASEEEVGRAHLRKALTQSPHSEHWRFLSRAPYHGSANPFEVPYSEYPKTEGCKHWRYGLVYVKTISAVQCSASFRKRMRTCSMSLEQNSRFHWSYNVVADSVISVTMVDLYLTKCN